MGQMNWRHYIAIAGLCLVSSNTYAADTAVKALMHHKLEAAHGLLDALALEDYPKMEHFASMLHDISRASTWTKSESIDFQYYAKGFQNAADYLVEQSKKRNLEGVTMGYVRTTLECVQCHKFVRSRSATSK